MGKKSILNINMEVMEVDETIHKHGCNITYMGENIYLVSVDVRLPKFDTTRNINIGYYKSFKMAKRKCRKILRMFQKRYEKQLEDKINEVRNFVGPFENAELKHTFRESWYLKPDKNYNVAS